MLKALRKFMSVLLMSLIVFSTVPGGSVRAAQDDNVYLFDNDFIEYDEWLTDESEDVFVEDTYEEHEFEKGGDTENEAISTIEPDYWWYISNPDASVFIISTEAEAVGFIYILNGTAEGIPQFNFMDRTIMLGNDIYLSEKLPEIYDDDSFLGATDTQGFDIIELFPQTEEEDVPEEGGEFLSIVVSDYSWYTSNPNASIFTVNNEEQLRGFADIVNGTASGISQFGFSGRTVRLGNNIDLTGEWKPIGFSSCGYDDITYRCAFQGTFNGQGYEIRDLFVNASSNYQYSGFFGIISGTATIRNLGISVGANGVNANSVQSVDSNTISLSGDRSTFSAAGGLVGEVVSDSNLSIENCYVIGGNLTTGGARIYTNASLTITGSANNTKNSHAYAYAGGFIGLSSGTVTIRNSYTRIGVNARSFAQGAGGIGIFGIGDGRGEPISYAGGFIGLARGTVSLIYSYVTGNVYGFAVDSARSQDRYSWVGNYFGYWSSASGANNYSLQGILSSGNSSRRTLSYLVDTRTAAQMRTQSNYVGWDFNNIWIMRSGQNDNYPMHRIRVRDLEMDTSAVWLDTGEVHQLANPTIIPPNADNPGYTWSSNNSNIAAVNSSGVATAVNLLNASQFPSGLATARITATTADGGFQKSRDVNVQQRATAITISPIDGEKTARMRSGGSPMQLTATVSPGNIHSSNAGAVWISGSPDIATVDANGLVTANTAGRTGFVTITASTNNQRGDNFSDTFVIEVYDLITYPMPNAQIDFANERLTGLENGEYRFNGAAYNVTNGTFDINTNWMGGNLQIVRAGNNTTHRDSPAQSINIPTRPNPPTNLNRVNCSAPGINDGRILNVANSMEYQRVGDANWSAITGTSVDGLAEGEYRVRFKATVGSFTSSYTVVSISRVNAPGITTTSTLPNGMINVTYGLTFAAVSEAPVTWSVFNGNLPNGLALSENGILSGTPREYGSFNFTVRAANSAGADTRTFTLVINALPVIITVSLPNGTKNNAYHQILAASGYRIVEWSISSGSLPDGLSLSSDGIISGSPNAEGTFNFTVKAENDVGNDTKNFTITISSLPIILESALPRGMVNNEYGYSLTASGTEPINWRVTAGTIPPGLSLDEATGRISGTPTDHGNYYFTVTATNNFGSSQENILLIVNQLYHIHSIVVLDNDTFSSLANAIINIDGLEYKSDNFGTFVIEGVSGVKAVQTSADNYKNNVQRYNITNNTQRLIILETDPGDRPYISMATETRDGIDLRSQPMHFTEGDSEMLELIVLGEWTNPVARYELYQSSFRESGKDVQGVSIIALPGSFSEIPGSAVFRLAPGQSLHPERLVMLKMVSEDGAESQPIKLNLTISRKNPVSNQYNNSYDVSNTTGMDLFGIALTNTSGQEFARLFPLDFSIGAGDKIPVEIKSELEPDGYRIRGTIGFKSGNDVLKQDEDFNKLMKDITSAGSKEKRKSVIEEYKEWTTPNRFVGVTEFEYKVVGFLEVKLDNNGNVVHFAGGIISEMEVGRSWGQTFILGVVPVYYELKLSIGAEFRGELGFYRVDEIYGGDLNFGVAGQIKITIPKITVGAGVGIRGLATIGVEGSAGLEITGGGKWNIAKTGIDPIWKGEITAEGAVKIKILFVVDLKWNLIKLNPPHKLWDIDDNAEATGTMMMAFGDIPDGMYPELSLASRDYAQRTTAWNGGGNQIATFSSVSIGNGTDSVNSLQEWIMPDTIPQIAKVGDDLVILFQYDDPARKSGESTILMYSVNRFGFWSEPQPVWESNTADLFYNYIVKDDELYVVWQKLNSQVTTNVDDIDDEEAKNAAAMLLLQEVSEKSEIAYAKFNKVTGTFENQIFVTNNNALDMYPTIAVNGTESAVLWVSNDASDPLGIEGTYSIMKSDFAGGVFGAPVKLYETELFVSELAAGFVDGKLETVFAAGDADNTAGYIITADTAMRFTGSGSSMAFKYQDGLFYWHTLGSVYTLDPLTRVATRVDIPDVNAVSSSYRLVKADNKDALVWISNNGDDYSINAAMYLGSGRWSLPITLLTIDDATIWFADAVASEDGIWNIVMNTVDPETEKSSLVFATVTPKTETELVYALASQREVVDGLQPVHISVRNLGETTIQELNINISSAQKSFLVEKLNSNIEPGHTADFTVYIDTSNLDAVTEMTVHVYADNEHDPDNNYDVIQLGEVDVSISLTQYHIDDTVLVSAQIGNRSATPANVIVRVIEDSLEGNVVRVEELGVTNQFEDRLFTHRINLGDINFGDENRKVFFFKVDTLEPNYSEFSSYELVIVYKPETFETIDLPTREITIVHATSVRIDNDSIHLKLDDENQNAINLSATVFPSNATYRNVRWEVEDANIAHVDSFGVIRGLRVGETQITAITHDGGYTDSVRVVVTEKQVERYQLNITAGSGGSIFTGENGQYEAGEMIEISAIAGEGYIFKQWTSPGGGDFVNAYSTGTTFIMPANDATITAEFVSLKTYTVSFNVDGQITEVLVNAGGKISQPANPVKTGYTFDGWRIGNVAGAHYDFETPVTADIELYAAWKQNPSEATITITGIMIGNGQANVNFAIASANGKGYTVYLSETNVAGSFKAYSNVNYNNNGAHIRGLTNGKKYYAYIKYNDAKGNISKSGVVELFPNK